MHCCILYWLLHTTALVLRIGPLLFLNPINSLILGYGSGVHLRSRHSTTELNLITLYEQTRAIRSRVRGTGEDRVQSLLLEAQPQPRRTHVDADDDLPPPTPVLKPRIQELCRTIDSFVCIVDASACANPDASTRNQVLQAYREELRLLLDPQWSKYVSFIHMRVCMQQSCVYDERV
jgi:hypothetical protein